MEIFILTWILLQNAGVLWSIKQRPAPEQAAPGLLVSLCTHTLAELTDEESTQRCLLVVILNVYVDHMHWLTRLLLSGI